MIKVHHSHCPVCESKLSIGNLNICCIYLNKGKLHRYVVAFKNSFQLLYERVAIFNAFSLTNELRKCSITKNNNLLFMFDEPKVITKEFINELLVLL